MWMQLFWVILFSIPGVFLIGLAVRNFVRASASRRWPSTEGRIVRAFVLVDHSSDEGEGYTATVKYDYDVGGMTYRGTRLRFGQTGSWNRPQAERVIARYVVGAGRPCITTQAILPMPCSFAEPGGGTRRSRWRGWYSGGRLRAAGAHQVRPWLKHALPLGHWQRPALRRAPGMWEWAVSLRQSPRALTKAWGL